MGPIKTTVELPDSLLRRAKNAALKEGLSLKQLLTEALELRLSRLGLSSKSRVADPRWRKAFGALKHLRSERRKIEKAIAEEFEQIEAEDRQ